MKKIISLNGTWKFTPIHDQKPNNNLNRAEGQPLYAHPRLHRTGWESVSVPGVWQKYAEKYSIYEGVCWFFREFAVGDFPENSLAKLVFKGVNYKATVYVNGKFVGTHESAYTEFAFDISQYLHSGTNAIAVEVDNRPIIVKWPNDWGYGVYGGIHRDVFVEVYSGEYVSDVELTPSYDPETGCGLLKLTAKGNTNWLEICVDNKAYPLSGKDGAFDALLEIPGVIPWSPENPKLYPITVTANGEVYADCTVGFRSLGRKDRKILLNGTPVEIKGACYLCDSPKTGLAMPREELEADLLLMKQANVNAVRTHYPMGDAFYELCDKMGLMVWIEPNIYCSKPANNKTNTIFQQQPFIDVAVSMTEEMIHGARRFASVVFYGIGNECNTDHPEAIPFFETISNTVRQADSTRLVGYASLYGQVGKIAHTVDVMGINSYYGWYGTIDSRFNIYDERNGEMRIADISELFPTIDKVLAETPGDMPVLLTEFGGDSIPGFLCTECALWSENYHAQVVEKYIGAMRKHSQVAGGFVFAFADYLDPSKPMNGRWNGFNLKGMVDYDRKYKLPYYALQKMYK